MSEPTRSRKKIDYCSRPFKRIAFHFRTHTLTIASLLILMLIGCSDNSESPELPDLDIYIERFEEEAKMRGYEFDLSGIQTVYRDEIEVRGTNYCGYGYYNYQGNSIRRIEISTGTRCNWINLSDIERENLFFHEIGHAFLNRPHDESLLCDGSPLSIMNSTTNTFKIYNTTDPTKRAYYISELIDRIAALDQCIDYETGWYNDSIYYQYEYEDDSWIFDSRDGNYQGAQIASGDQQDDAISIELVPGMTPEEAGRWFRRIDNPNIPECSEVTMRVTMNSEMLTGKGAAITIRAFYAPVAKNGAEIVQYSFETTTDTPVSGKLQDYVEEVTFDCYSRKTTFIVLFLRLMEGTEGKVVFDNIQLIAKK